MLRIHFKTAWRNLSRQRVTTLINLSGLSIGMTAAVLIFLWVNTELNYDNYHRDASSIYRIKSLFPSGDGLMQPVETSPYLLGEHARTGIPGVLKVARAQSMQHFMPFFNIKGEFTKETSAAYVDSGWFDMFKYEFVNGNPTAFKADPFSIILTASKAKQYFGNEDPVGQVIRVDTVNYVVRGTVTDNPVNSSFQFDVFFSMHAKATTPESKKNLEYWGNYNYLTFLRLAPAADTAAISARLGAILNRERERTNLAATLLPLRDLRFESDLRYSTLPHGSRKIIYIFSVLGVVLLLIACINYVNLTTARATLRAKEVSVRKIVGAERVQLLWQFIVESAVVSIIALLLTVLLLRISLPLFNNFTEKNFSLGYDTWEFWMIAGTTLIATIIMTSIYPAILLSSFKPMSIFRGLNVLQVRDSSLRKTLVVLQFTVSAFLIVGTIVIYRQLQYVNHQATAYDRSQLFSFSIPWKSLNSFSPEQREAFTGGLKDKILQQSSVTSVSLTGFSSVVSMTGTSSGNSNDWDGRNEEFRPAIAFFQVDTSFKNILNLEMKQGRWFLPGNGADKHNSILNETAVREFGIQEPVLGKRFTSQGDTGVIVGVVKDFYYKTLHEKIGPVVIRNDQSYSNNFLVKSAPGKILESVDKVKTAFAEILPGIPFDYAFLDEQFAAIYKDDRKTAVLIWLFSAIAIFISCLGLFGLAAFTAEKRTREIGIRKVLGASVSNIIVLLSREFVLLVVIALVVASPLAWWAMNRWLESFAYHVDVSWWMFAAAGFISVAVSVITIGFQAIRAALANPVKSLRTE